MIFYNVDVSSTVFIFLSTVGFPVSAHSGVLAGSLGSVALSAQASLLLY